MDPHTPVRTLTLPNGWGRHVPVRVLDHLDGDRLLVQFIRNQALLIVPASALDPESDT